MASTTCLVRGDRSAHSRWALNSSVVWAVLVSFAKVNVTGTNCGVVHHEEAIRVLAESR